MIEQIKKEGIVNRDFTMINDNVKENLPANLGAVITDIRGSRDYATITYDNGYVIKVYGELMPGAKFIVYKSSIKKWEAPHDEEPLTVEMKEKLIADVESKNSPENVNIIFE